MLTIRPDRPLEVRFRTTLEVVQRVTTNRRVASFVAGAAARELILTHVFGLDTGVATRDVDFAVVVDTWETFEGLKQALIRTGQFTPHSRRQERLLPAKADSAYPVDLIPFGPVEHSPAQIAWPPDMDILLNVAGYSEVLQTALKVEIVAGARVNVASLPGLAILKVFAWLDRGRVDSKDARDLLLVLRRYHEAGNEDRLYDERISVLEAVDYHPEQAGAWLLGEDAARIATDDTRQRLLQVIEHPPTRTRLVTHMAAGLRGAEDSQTQASALLANFTKGLRSR